MKMAYKFYVIGSINMDLVASVDRFPKPGETVKGSSFFTTPGGKGGNQACALGRLGADVHMVGKVGDDSFGDDYLSYFEKEGISTEHIGRAERVSTGIAVIEVEPSGENHIVLVPGANDRVDTAYVDEISENFDERSIVLLQLEVPYPTVLHSLKTAKRRGARTILDPAPAFPLPAEIYQYVDFITPNSTEISLLTEGPSETEEELREAAGHFLSLGTSTVVAKRGAEGASIFSKELEAQVEGFRVEAVDTTAAGDSFNAGLAFALGGGYELREAVRFANAVGALSTLKMGAQTAMPSLDEVEKLYSSI
jgi:ribokinase